MPTVYLIDKRDPLPVYFAGLIDGVRVEVGRVKVTGETAHESLPLRKTKIVWRVKHADLMAREGSSAILFVVRLL